MLFLKIVGWVAVIFGLMFLFAPNTLSSLNKSVNRILIDIDAKAYNMRIGIGIALCLVSAMVFFVVYYMAQKFGMR